MIMLLVRKRIAFLPVVLVCSLFWAPSVQANASVVPEITSQGFRIDVEQYGILGRFERIRIRVEAPERIDVLSIRERSYEVDLASTPERSHFPLFGLESRPRSRKDVTLDFQNYINAKIDSEGRYEIHIRVIDEKRQSASAVLMINVGREETKNEVSDMAVSVETASFTLRRVGSGDVQGEADFGLTWKTIESIQVTIQLARSELGAAKLVDLRPSDYEGIRTKAQLNQRVADAEGVEQIRLPAANDKAAGRVFAVVSRDEPYILKVERSETRLTPLGTTVTLNGKYKH